MTVSRKHFVMMFLGLFFLVSNAQADRRSYVWTYEYQTIPKGEVELEHYSTFKIEDMHKFDKKNTWQPWLELEYGLTDRWDVSVYSQWQLTNTSTQDDFEYAETKFRTRYRLWEKGVMPIDTLFYLEYIYPNDSDRPDVLEGKLVLAKDFGKWNVAYNQILKQEVNNGGKTEHEYALGLSYESSPAWKFGLESTGNYTEDKFRIGPTVSWATEKFWVTVGGLRGLNDRTDDLQLRMIFGIPF